MATRYALYADNLWRAAAAAFNTVVASGLPALSLASIGSEAAEASAGHSMRSTRQASIEPWPALAIAFEAFLVGPPPGLGPERVRDSPL